MNCEINLEMRAGRHLGILKRQVKWQWRQRASSHREGSGPDAGTHEQLQLLACIFLLYEILNGITDLQQLRRPGKGNSKCPIAIADLVMLYNKCMEGQYGKGDPLSFNLYKICPQLKTPFIKHCKVFEHLLRFLVPEYSVLPVTITTLQLHHPYYTDSEPVTLPVA